MIKEEGSFEDLSKHGILFQNLMENSGKMDERTEEEKDVENSENKMFGLNNEAFRSSHQTTPEKESKYVLVKEEERETGLISWNVLMRYGSLFFMA